MQMSSLSSRGARARRRWRDTAFYPLKVSDTLHVLQATQSYLSSANLDSNWGLILLCFQKEFLSGKLLKT